MSLVESENSMRQHNLQFVKGCIDLALDLGTDVVHGLAGTTAPGVDRQQAWEWLLEGSAECSRYAEERNVKFGMEAVAMCLVANMADLDRLLADLGSEKLYVNFDPSHLPSANEDPVRWVRNLGQRIVHVDMKDARIYEPHEERVSFSGVPLEFECPPLGKGIVDFSAIVGALREIGYRGISFRGIFRPLLWLSRGAVGPMGGRIRIQGLHGFHTGHLENLQWRGSLLSTHKPVDPFSNTETLQTTRLTTLLRRETEPGETGPE